MNDRAPLDRIFAGAYGRPADGAIFLDVPMIAAQRGLRASARLARRMVTELRDEGIEGLIVARVRGLPGARRDDVAIATREP